jgi:hypothetical protein
MQSKPTLSEEKKYLERLKFYADTPQGRNKYFCWTLTSILMLKEALWRFFDKGWHIRSAWYEKIDCRTKEVIENTKLNLIDQFNEWADQRTKQIKKSLR